MVSYNHGPSLRDGRYADALASGAGAPAWMANTLVDEGLAVVATQIGIDRDYQSGLDNPYHRVMSTKYYDAGLGDTNWLDVIKTVAGNVSQGVGGAISGSNPYVTQLPPTYVYPTPSISPSSSMPSWLVPVALGGGVLILGVLLLRRK